MISIVIPLYNKETQIRKTLESVFAQTYTDYEIVIVNDGSTDKSVEVVEFIKDPRIRLIHQKNAGVSAARNRGIEEARGEYIALLDADDLWKPEYLETIMGMIEKYPDCKVFATNYEFQDNKGIIKPTIIRKLPFNSVDGILDNYFEVASVSNPPICSISIVSTAKAFKTIGGFPVGIKSGEDLLTWARLACRNKIAYCTKALAIFNVEGYNSNEKPKRIPQTPDRVSDELINLYKQYHHPYLKQYISFWHKMRSVIFIRLNDRKNSVSESIKAIKWNPTNFKAYALLMLNFIPKSIRPF